MHYLQQLIADRKSNPRLGIYSCCSVNERVLRATLITAKENDTYALIEATANQVNQFGGYTGMHPSDFFAYAHNLAKELEFPSNRLILGGDHLGPTAWPDLDEETAMKQSEDLVREFVLAGFEKIHLDTSVRLGSDIVPPDDHVIASRGARLCRVSEQAFLDRKASDPTAQAPVYIIGSEVPIPGGMQEKHDMEITKRSACEATLSVYHDVFEKNGLSDAFSRVIGLVVQPGVEFGNETVIDFNENKASELSSMLKDHPEIVFEGHSTDYQTEYGLSRMVYNGYSILKVGPELTFAMREGLFALESIERELFKDSKVALSDFRNTLDRVMMVNDGYWKKHCFGKHVDLERAFGFSDRCRYYMPDPEIRSAELCLMKNLSDIDIPLYLISQYLPEEFKSIRNGKLRPTAEDMLNAHISSVCNRYLKATGRKD